MNVPLPFLSAPMGLGSLLSTVVSALFGGGQCLACQRRASALDRAVTFVPIGGAR
jgi:hypothetical protein